MLGVVFSKAFAMSYLNLEQETRASRSERIGKPCRNVRLFAFVRAAQALKPAVAHGLGAAQLCPA